MPEIGMVGKLAWFFLEIIRHSELLSLKRPSSAYRAERRFAKIYRKWVGFYPFRGPDASLTRRPSYQESRRGSTRWRRHWRSFVVISALRSIIQAWKLNKKTCAWRRSELSSGTIKS